MPQINFFSVLRIINAFGNGDYHKGEKLLEDITERLNHARAKHKWGKNDEIRTAQLAANALYDEVHEWEHAVACETPERQYDESLDILAVAVRIANREFDSAKR